MFFSFDGLDGAGKTTQIELFVAWLREQGKDVVLCQDPGSTPLGERIRELLLKGQMAMGFASEMLLFMAARAQLVEEVIKPALAKGQVVVSDRFLLANLVYQGHAGGLPVEEIRRVGQFATAGIYPDLVFVLDMPPRAAMARMQQPPDRIEGRPLDYHLKLRDGFRSETAKDPRRHVLIDAQREVAAVQADIQAAASRVLSAAVS
jgi:dTMP kinase